MSKKKFSFDEMLEPKKEVKKKIGRPKDPKKRIPTKSTQEGTKNNEARATFIINEDDTKKIRSLAHWEQTGINEFVREIFSQYIEEYEKKNGKIELLNKFK